MKNKEIICFQTDKSGSISVDTPQNYIESMRPHLEGRVESSEKEYEKTEKLDCGADTLDKTIILCCIWGFICLMNIKTSFA